MIFTDRREAGRLLSEEIIGKYKRNLGNPVVVAIPRGGVVIAEPIAKVLNAPLEIVLVKKIGAPFNEELAVGAITEDGDILLNPDITPDVAVRLGITDDYIYQKSKEALGILKKRKELYGGSLKDLDIKGRDVILVDDGVATGLTTEAGVLSVRNLSPNRIILAIPVIPYEKYDELNKLVDELIVLEKPVNFTAVGQFYNDFSQTTDREVLEILNRYRN
ncbi:MAG: phosphoribosyltransferase [Persephonella sp.]|nr:MAG: phosphoribosyltransferase [Persephonella sp.]RUM62110.1 MAG: phosphoribosyltransferase [Persephonella sp.]